MDTFVAMVLLEHLKCFLMPYYIAMSYGLDGNMNYCLNNRWNINTIYFGILYTKNGWGWIDFWVSCRIQCRRRDFVLIICTMNDCTIITIPNKLLCTTKKTMRINDNAGIISIPKKVGIYHFVLHFQTLIIYITDAVIQHNNYYYLFQFDQ